MMTIALYELLNLSSNIWVFSYFLSIHVISIIFLFVRSLSNLNHVLVSFFVPRLIVSRPEIDRDLRGTIKFEINR